MGSLILFNIYFFTVFGFSSIVFPSVSSQFISDDGHCVMYDRCEGESLDAPCIYNGPPKPLEKDVIPTANMTSVELLKAMCSDFVHGAPVRWKNSKFIEKELENDCVEMPLAECK